MGDFENSYQLTCFIQNDNGQLQKLFTAPASSIKLEKKPTLWEKIKDKIPFIKHEPKSYTWGTTSKSWTATLDDCKIEYR